MSTFDRGPHPSIRTPWWAKDFKPGKKATGLRGPKEDGAVLIATLHDNRGTGPINKEAILWRINGWDDVADALEQAEADRDECIRVLQQLRFLMGPTSDPGTFLAQMERLLINGMPACVPPATEGLK